MSDVAYAGSELELFARATNWKSYFGRRLAPYVGRDAAEVGAGTGGTTAHLWRSGAGRWLCVEPTAALAAHIEAARERGDLPAGCEVLTGSLQDVPPNRFFDTVLYIDVLEHIDNDRAELACAADRLRPGGHVIVLSPAHQWLYTPFDAALGHCRRYSRRTLTAAAPDTLAPVTMQYLDSVGILLLLINRLLFRRSMPTSATIAVWDKAVIPLSRAIDPLLGYSCGKSVLGVWRKR